MGDLPENPNPGRLTEFYKGFNGTCGECTDGSSSSKLCLLSMAGVDLSGLPYTSAPRLASPLPTRVSSPAPGQAACRPSFP